MSELTREQVEQHADSIVYGNVDDIKDHVDVLLSADAALRARLAEVEQELVEATSIIKEFTEIGPITQHDIQWATESLSQLDLLNRQLAEKDAEIAKLEQELNEALGALGYPVPGDTPNPRYQCGLCGPKDAEIGRLKHEISQLLFFTPGGG